MGIIEEVQSRSRTDATNLETTNEEKEVLEIALKEVQIECEEVFQTNPYISLEGHISEK
jgi:hypothetical protein